MDHVSSTSNDTDSASTRFAKRVLGILLPDDEAAVFHSYLQIATSGGPSTSTMVRLAKVARGEATMNRPRQDMRDALDVVIAKAQRLDDGAASGRTQEIWDESVRDFIAETLPRPAGLDVDGIEDGLQTEVDALRDEVGRLRDEVRRLSDTHEVLLKTVNKLLSQ